MKDKEDLKKLLDSIKNNDFLKGNIKNYKSYFNDLKSLLQLFWTYRETSVQVSKISGLLFLHDVAKAITYSKCAFEVISGNINRENETEEEWNEFFKENLEIANKYKQSINDFLTIVEIFIKNDTVDFYFTEVNQERVKMIWNGSDYIIDESSVKKENLQNVKDIISFYLKRDEISRFKTI